MHTLFASYNSNIRSCTNWADNIDCLLDTLLGFNLLFFFLFAVEVFSCYPEDEQTVDFNFISFFVKIHRIEACLDLILLCRWSWEHKNVSLMIVSHSYTFEIWTHNWINCSFALFNVCYYQKLNEQDIASNLFCSNNYDI
jgi:hypothetical protein